MRVLSLLVLAGVFLLATFAGGLTHSIVADWLRHASPHAAYWLVGVIVSLLVAVWWFRHKRQRTTHASDHRPGG